MKLSHLTIVAATLTILGMASLTGCRPSKNTVIVDGPGPPDHHQDGPQCPQGPRKVRYEDFGGLEVLWVELDQVPAQGSTERLEGN